MTLNAQYWQMTVLTNSGQRQIKVMPPAQRWFQAASIDTAARFTEGDRGLQTYLWQIWRDRGTDAQLALLCLRCWISHQISATCYQLASQFGANYGFEASDLYPLVLDDEGRLDPAYQPLSIRILEQYEPSQAALGTWVSRVTKSHSEINRFLLDCGLYRISDWALLNDTTVKSLARSLPNLNASDLAKKSALLSAYHQVYRRDRIAQRQIKGRASRCQTPTHEQLLKIAPDQSPHDVLGQLGELASQLREYRVAVRRGTPATRPFDESIVSHIPTSQPEDNAIQDEFVQRYRSQFLASLDEAIASVSRRYVESYNRRKPHKGALFLSALNLFHCEGYSMGKIAQQLGLSSQVQVTRLLQLKRFRTEVCAYWFNQLKQQVKAEALRAIAPARLGAIAQQLEAILAEETETVMTEAAAEAQISKNRETKSVFARRLCDRLTKLKT